MKKLFLTLVAIVATTLSGFAQISLQDAYQGLVNLPGSTEKTVKDVQLNADAAITNLHATTVKSPRYVQDFIYTYESLPVTNVLISAGNQNEMACAFTEPSESDTYNVLFLVGEKGGPYVAAYGQTNAAGLEAIRDCEVALDGDNLVMAVGPQIDMVEFIEIAVVE